MKYWPIIGVAALTLTACGAAPGTSEDSQETSSASTETAGASGDILPETVLAEVEYEGGKVTFYETDPYGILIVGRAEPGQVLPAALNERMEAAELYEFLTGEAAPEALVVAADRQARLEAEEAATLGSGEVPELQAGAEFEEDAEVEDLVDAAAFRESDGAARAHSGNHTASEWVDEYCNWSWPNYTVCKTNRTCSDNSCTVSDVKAKWAWGYANPYRGNIRFRFQRKNLFGNWTTKASLEITEGHTLGIKTPGALTYKTGHRFQVLDGAGDGFHHQSVFTW